MKYPNNQECTTTTTTTITTTTDINTYITMIFVGRKMEVTQKS